MPEMSENDNLSNEMNKLGDNDNATFSDGIYYVVTVITTLGTFENKDTLR